MTALTDEPLVLGEGLRWLGDRLVMVDLLAGRLLEHTGRRGDPLRELARLDVTLGAVAAVAGRPGQWVAAAGDGVALLDEGRGLVWLDRPEQRQGGSTRMNDAVVDPAGRFWAGSMAYDSSTPAGSLYRVDHDGSVQQVWTGLPVVNGPAFSADGATMYLSDSAGGRVLRFAVGADGSLSEPETLWRAEPGTSPDGLTVSGDGAIWVALWGAGAVLVLEPDGTVRRRVGVPARHVTSVAVMADRLLVTSATHGLRSPGAGDGLVHEVAETEPEPIGPTPSFRWSG